MKDSEIIILVFGLLFIIAFLLFLSMVIWSFLDIGKTERPKIELTLPDLPNNKIFEKWVCYDCGQDLLTFSWHIELMNIDDLKNNKIPSRTVFVEGKKNFEEALQEAIKKIETI